MRLILQKTNNLAMDRKDKIKLLKDLSEGKTFIKREMGIFFYDGKQYEEIESSEIYGSSEAITKRYEMHLVFELRPDQIAEKEKFFQLLINAGKPAISIIDGLSVEDIKL
jgi:hypothetical protein